MFKIIIFLLSEAVISHARDESNVGLYLDLMCREDYYNYIVKDHSVFNVNYPNNSRKEQTRKP